MSEKQKDLRLRMMNEENAEKVQQLRAERKSILKSMTKEIKQIKEREIDEIVEEIEKTKDDAKMFKATKKLERKPFENPIVHDKEGKNVTEPQQIYEIVKEHFQKQFFKCIGGEGRNLSPSPPAPPPPNISRTLSTFCRILS